VQDKHIYRRQLLDYLNRYDSGDPQNSFTILSTPQRDLGDGEWFRKPPTLNQSPLTNFSSFSQASDGLDLVGESAGLTYTEGEDYLSTPCVKGGPKFDVLAWWSQNEAIYPNLARVARDILAVPISQVGVERVFNIARDVLGDRRHKLSSQVIRQIMILKDSIACQQSQELDDAPFDEVDDLLELPACTDEPESSGTESDNSCQEEEPVTPSRRQKHPRKRARPARYCDNQL